MIAVLAVLAVLAGFQIFFLFFTHTIHQAAVELLYPICTAGHFAQMYIIEWCFSFLF